MARTNRLAPHTTLLGRALLGVALVVTVVAYAPGMRAPFVLDDVASIPANATIRALWPPSVALHPPENTTVAGRPVVNYSLALNYAVNRWLGVDQRPDPFGRNKTVGYHVVNLAVHVLCGVLLFGITRRTIAHGTTAGAWSLDADVVAGVTTALWLVHPLQTEAVIYLIQRTELLVSACYLATLYMSVRAWEARTQRAALGWRAAAVVVCLLGMGSKEVMITAPIVVVLYDRVFRVGSWRELAANRGAVLFYAALAATSVLTIATIVTNARSGTVGFGLGITWFQYLYSQCWAIARYLRLALWPSQLTFDYGQRPITGLRGVPGALVLTSFALVSLLAWTRPARWGWLAFLGTSFFLLLAPSSSVVPIATEIAAERRVYLALAPILLIAVVGVMWMQRRITRSTARVAVSWLAVGVAVTFAAITFQRSRVYASAEALWRDTVAKAPSNARAYDNLAATLLYQDPPRLAEAKALYERAIAIDSLYPYAWPGLASIAIEEGRFGEAESLLRRVLTIAPGYADATDKLGRLLVRLGRPAEALPYLEQYAAAYPSGSSLVALATAYMQLGRLDNASAALRSALSLNPEHADAMHYLGGLLVEQGHGAEAIPLLERAVSARAASPVDYGLLSIAYAQSDRADDAASAARVAVERAQGSATVYILAGRAMLLAHRTEDADRYFSDAIRINLTDPEALTYLGITRVAEGKRGDAVTLFRRALAIDASYALAKEALASLR